MKGGLIAATLAFLALVGSGPRAVSAQPNGINGNGAAVLNADDRLDVPFSPGSPHDASIPDPESFIGHPVGSRFTPHYRLVEYFEAIATRSDRVKWETYGSTVEGRPLGTLVISSPANMAALETIRTDLQRLSDPAHTSRQEARRLCERLPVVVWLSYGVHGDEASSSEAALMLAWHLAAGTGPDVTSILDSAIVVIDPCLNPDGHERYVNWFTMTTGLEPNRNPNAWEHDEPWPGGRYNHYMFDLNRDWAWLTQQESRAREAAYRRWKPQVHVDFHEMSYGSSYFFFPAAEPFNTNLLPQVRYWGEVFGRGNAQAFDEHGWRYFTAEDFDLYYPGYGDSWPTLQGATGMTYEQAGHGSAGIMVDRSDGTVLTLRERARHHYVASLATIATARRERFRRLTDFYLFFDEGVVGRISGPAAYLFPPGSDPGRTAELMNLLLSHGAEIGKASGRLNVSDPRDYNGRATRKEFAEGTYVVSMRQPLRSLLNALLEPEAELPETLFYDISAWSLPLAFGVDAYWTDREPSGNLVPVTHAEPPAGGVVGDTARVAWLLPWDTNAAPRLLTQLLKMGVRTSFATRTFEIDGRLFDRGTIVIPVATNSDTLGPAIDRLSREMNQPVYAARSGWTGSGIDLGSDRIIPIRPPKIAIVTGDGVDATSFGALWFLLDDQYRIPATVIPLDNLKSANLSAFNVLVFPDDESGQGDGYRSALDSAAVDRVRRWAQGGGTFIGLKGGAAWATADVSGLTAVQLKPEEDEAAVGGEAGNNNNDKAREKEDLARRLATTEERERSERLKRIPGTILRVKLDPGHPLSFGYGGEAHILKTSDIFFEPTADGRNVGYYPDSPRISGYISKENEKRIANTSFLIVEPLGRGRAVLYNDDPNFRVFWYGLNRLFLNSLFFASGY